MKELYFDDFMIAKELYDWINNNVKKGATILELGSGKGSSYLAENYKMFCVENNKGWMKFDNINYIYAHLNNGWYRINERKLPKKYDLLIIDGPAGSYPRKLFLRHIEKFNLNIPIIIDDTHRSYEFAMANKLSELLKRDVEFVECKNKSFAIIR